ncbi:MAG: DUF6262 family protein, partial [Acidimicrobiales bacterium]
SPLTLAVRARSLDTRRRAVDALRRLDDAGEPITFTTVANMASVSRSWLYRDPDLRAEIVRLRKPASTPAMPSAQRTTTESERCRREALLDELRRLKEENKRLRDEVARVLGSQRASST